MSKRKFDDLEIDVLGFLLKKGEQRFVKIAEALFPQYAKSFRDDENHFRVALVRKLDVLRGEGYIEKKIESPKSVCYNIPEQKRGEVEKIVRRHRNLKAIESLSDEDIEKLIEENKKLKRITRIRELEDFPFLPLTAVIKKLLTLGFKIEDFYEKRHLYSSDPAYKHLREKMPKHIAVSPDNLHSYFTGFNELFSKNDYEFSLDEIEIKLIPASEVNGVTFVDEDNKKTRKQHILTEFEVGRKYGPGWVILTQKPIKGYYIIGAYKELLQLYEEQFNEEWLSWKENFELSDEDWEEIGQGIREIMIRDAGRIDLDAEIATEIVSYIAATKDDAFERLKKAFMKQGSSLEEAEKWAREEVEKAKPAKIKIQQFNELWLKWKSECNALTKEDFASLFNLYQNVYTKSNFEKQLEGFYQWLKKHEKEQINPTYLNAELKNKLRNQLLDTMKAWKEQKHPKSI
jgi:hypothetical protein